MIDKTKINFNLKWFLSNCHIYKYPSKSTLIHQGEKAENLFYIIEGIVSVFIKDDEGKEMTLYHLNKGNFIGENGLFEKFKKRNFWVKAKTSCEIAEISYKNFYHLIKVDINILLYLTYQISKRLQIISSEKVGNLLFLSKMGCVAKTLLKLSKSPNTSMHIKGVKIKINAEEVGKMSGCSKDTVLNILRMLKEQNLIEYNNTSIVVYGLY